MKCSRKLFSLRSCLHWCSSRSCSRCSMCTSSRRSIFYSSYRSRRNRGSTYFFSKNNSWKKALRWGWRRRGRRLRKRSLRSRAVVALLMIQINWLLMPWMNKRCWSPKGMMSTGMKDSWMISTVRRYLYTRSGTPSWHRSRCPKPKSCRKSCS